MTNFISAIQFEHVSWLYSIPVLMLFLAAVLWKNPLAMDLWSQQVNQNSKNVYFFPFVDLIQYAQNKPGQKSKYLLFFSQYTKYGLFFSLILLSLAQPYLSGKKLPDPSPFRDIVFLVDTSVTMSLKDYQVNNKRVERMAIVKNVLSHFIDNLKGNRIGITVFSKHAYTLSPLTTDYALLTTQLHRLESAVLTGRTSNPSEVLLYTAKQYMHSKEKPALVMLTDIDRPDRRIDPRAAATYLAGQGFHLHTIGIGAGSEKARDDEISNLIYQPANFQLLEEMAQAGKGKFIWAQDISSLNTALQHIQNTELRNINVKPEYIKEPLYMWCLLVALGWFVFWQLLPLLKVRA